MVAAPREQGARGARGWSFFHTTWNGADGINPGVATFLRANGDQAWFDAPDLAAQRATAEEIQRAVLEEAPYIPSGQYFSSTAYRRTVSEPLSEITAFWGTRRL